MSASLLGGEGPGPRQNLKIHGLNVRSFLSFLICKVETVHALLTCRIIVWIKQVPVQRLCKCWALPNKGYLRYHYWLSSFKCLSCLEAMHSLWFCWSWWLERSPPDSVRPSLPSPFPSFSSEEFRGGILFFSPWLNLNPRRRRCTKILPCFANAFTQVPWLAPHAVAIGHHQPPPATCCSFITSALICPLPHPETQCWCLS